jgi:hypothetical protein
MRSAVSVAGGSSVDIVLTHEAAAAPRPTNDPCARNHSWVVGHVGRALGSSSPTHKPRQNGACTTNAHEFPGRVLGSFAPIAGSTAPSGAAHIHRSSGPTHGTVVSWVAWPSNLRGNRAVRA